MSDRVSSRGEQRAAVHRDQMVKRAIIVAGERGKDGKFLNPVL
jgi:hypothetical protein